MNIEYLSTNVSVLLENSSDFDSSVSDYKYDADGRLYSDSGRGIRGIDYSWADKPQKMYLTTTSGIFQQDNTTMYCNHYADGVRQSNDLVTKKGITQTSQYTYYADSFVFDGRGQNGKPGLFSRLLLPWGYVDDKWNISDPIMAEGDDVIRVTKDGKSTDYIFTEGEYGKRVCALNLEIGATKKDATLGVYHVSGNKDAHGYYVTPGGEPDNTVNSKARIKDGDYPITTPSGGEGKWRCMGVGGEVHERQIRFHYVSGRAMGWTEGCFVLSSDYSKDQNNNYNFKEKESIAAYKSFAMSLGKVSFYNYLNISNRSRIGTKFVNPITHSFHLESLK